MTANFYSKIIIAVLSVVVIIAGVASASLYLKTITLQGQLEQSKSMMEKYQSDFTESKNERALQLKEKEKLQADTVSSLAQNNKLQAEKDLLDKNLKEAQKIIQNKAADLERMRTQLTELQKKSVKDDAPALKIDQRKEESSLKKKIISMEYAMKKRSSIYQYNLAVAYSQSGMYDEALDAYKKSAEFDPKNADAYYNMGILYENEQNNSEKAVTCYKRYLQLKPDAEDKYDIRARIAKLSM